MSQKILIIKHGALGDFFIAMGAFKAIKEHHQFDHIALLTTPPYVQLAYDCKLFNEILIDERPRFYNLFKLRVLRKQLLKYPFDRIYDLQNSSRTAWYYKLLGPGKRPEWNGIARGCSHPQTLPNRRKMHAYPRFKDQLRVAGIKEVPWPDLSWVKADIQKFNLNHPYILFVPGSSPTRLLKRWPGEKYGELASLLLDRGITPVVLGGRDDQDSIAKIKSVCPRVIDLSCKTSLYEIIELARSAKAVVGNDTGPLHMASIAKCPTVVLWSDASDPEVFAPQGNHVSLVIEPQIKELNVNRVESALKDRLAQAC